VIKKTPRVLATHRGEPTIMGKTKVRYSLPQEFFQKQSPNQLKGKLLYSITIPQLGIVANGLLDKTSPVDWILLDYIRRWELNKRAQAITRDGKRLVRINFRHLLECLPILQYFRIHSKPPITRRFQKLEELGLIHTFRAKDNTLFARLLDQAWECYQTRLSEQTEDEISPPLPPREEHPIPPREIHPVPPRGEQHNRESIVDQNNKSLIKEKHFNNFFSLKEKRTTNPNGSNHREDQDSFLTEEKRQSNSKLLKEAVKKLEQQTSFDEPKLKSTILAELKDVQLDPKKKAEVERELEWTRQKNLERFNGKLYQ